MSIKISNPTKRTLSSKTRNWLKHQVHQCLGINVHTIQNFPIHNERKSVENEYAIYTKDRGQDPRKIFKEVIDLEKNYFFGVLELKTKEKIFYLIEDIEAPLYVSKGNKMITFTIKDKKMIIHIK